MQQVGERTWQRQTAVCCDDVISGH